MNSKLTKQEDGTIQLNIIIPWKEIEQTKEEVIASFTKATTLPGFRKGKAPKKMVEEKVDKEKIREEVLKKLLPHYYVQSVKEYNLNPILNPKIHIHKIEEGKDWEFEALTCEAPEIDLNNYKDAIQKLTAKSKIIIPGKEQEAPKFDEIIKALLESIRVKIPSILVEGEVDRLLSQTLDEIKKLGLSLEQYLASTKRAAEDLRNEYRQKAEADIKIEFALQKIAEVEKITVEQKEVDEAILKAKDENERKNLEQNKYLLASILRQQKTLDFLKNL